MSAVQKPVKAPAEKAALIRRVYYDLTGLPPTPDEVELLQRDALQFLASTRERFDVVFLDPPYRSEMLPRCFALLVDRLNRGGAVYFESDSGHASPMGWQITKSGRAGKVRFHLAKKIDDGDQGPSDDKSQPERQEFLDQETDAHD